MRLPTLQQIETAQAVVCVSMTATPQSTWPLFSRRVGVEAWIKYENHSPGGAFNIDRPLFTQILEESL